MAPAVGGAEVTWAQRLPGFRRGGPESRVPLTHGSACQVGQIPVVRAGSWHPWRARAGAHGLAGHPGPSCEAGGPSVLFGNSFFMLVHQVMCRCTHWGAERLPSP